MSSYQQDHAAERRIATWRGWDDVYRSLFPNLLRTEPCSDTQQQRAGVDRVLYLPHRVSTVDEKYDSHSTGNFFLETVADKARGTPGWLRKQLVCDYIGYLFMQPRCFYLLPYPKLVAAWDAFGDGWTASFGAREIRNVDGRGWVTVGVPVPCHLVCHTVDSARMAVYRAGSWVRRPV